MPYRRPLSRHTRRCTARSIDASLTCLLPHEIVPLRGSDTITAGAHLMDILQMMYLHSTTVLGTPVFDLRDRLHAHKGESRGDTMRWTGEYSTKSTVLTLYAATTDGRYRGNWLGINI